MSIAASAIPTRYRPTFDPNGDGLSTQHEFTRAVVDLGASKPQARDAIKGAHDAFSADFHRLPVTTRPTFAEGWKRDTAKENPGTAAVAVVTGAAVTGFASGLLFMAAPTGAIVGGVALALGLGAALGYLLFKLVSALILMRSDSRYAEVEVERQVTPELQTKLDTMFAALDAPPATAHALTPPTAARTMRNR